jgi:large subunit ribosomal protein L18
MSYSKIEKRIKRKERVTSNVKKHNKSNRPILTIFKSNKNISAQVIDITGKVLLSITSSAKKLADKLKGKSGIEIAKFIGAEIAKEAIKKNISEVVFNKGPYLYSGRIEAFCEEARKNGLKF